MEKPPLIAHIVHRFSVGGLENGIVNLINNMPRDRYRHVIISLTEAGEFKHRIQRDDVQFIDLRKKLGQDIGYHWRLWKILRMLKPAIVHTRNIGPMETVVTARLAGVSACIHGEHGWDMSDLNGSNNKYRWFRRLLSPFVTHYITMSVDIRTYMADRVGIAGKKLTQLYNGVDTGKFFPLTSRRDGALFPEKFLPDDGVIVGMVGRMSEVKNPLFLVRAFAELIESNAELAKKLRLLIVGGGELHEEVIRCCQGAGISDKVWLPASRDDVPALMQAMDMFVLPSHNEGISNTILEAMATGLPVIASNVGGNPELVIDGETGQLVTSNQQSELASAIRLYANDKKIRTAHGNAGRLRVEKHFSMQRMVARYLAVYDASLARLNNDK